MVSMSEEGTCIVVVPSTWNHTEDSVLIEAGCGHRSWITPQAKEMVDSGEAIARCVPCIKGSLLDTDEVAIGPWALGFLEAAGVREEEALRLVEKDLRNE